MFNVELPSCAQYGTHNEDGEQYERRIFLLYKRGVYQPIVYQRFVHRSSGDGQERCRFFHALDTEAVRTLSKHFVL